MTSYFYCVQPIFYGIIKGIVCDRGDICDSHEKC